MVSVLDVQNMLHVPLREICPQKHYACERHREKTGTRTLSPTHFISFSWFPFNFIAYRRWYVYDNSNENSIVCIQSSKWHCLQYEFFWGANCTHTHAPHARTISFRSIQIELCNLSELSFSIIHNGRFTTSSNRFTVDNSLIWILWCAISHYIGRTSNADRGWKEGGGSGGI